MTSCHPLQRYSFQRVGTTWTKASRGGAGAAARNQCPSAFRLPVDAVWHSVDMAEENQFEPLHESADVVPASVREELSLRIRGAQLTMLPQVSAFWIPRRHRRPPRHPVSRGTWLRWTINYRLGLDHGWSYGLVTWNTAFQVEQSDRALS